VNSVPTVEVQRVLDDPAATAVADDQKLSLDHPIIVLAL
jgi:hypothetical protein